MSEIYTQNDWDEYLRKVKWDKFGTLVKVENRGSKAFIDWLNRSELFHDLFQIETSFWGFFVKLQHRKVMMGEYLKRAIAAAAEQNGASVCWDEDYGKRFPALLDFLCSNVGPDGKPRQTASLVLFTRDGCFKANLKDKALKLSKWGEGDTIDECLRTIEEELKNL